MQSIVLHFQTLWACPCKEKNGKTQARFCSLCHVNATLNVCFHCMATETIDNILYMCFFSHIVML